jgi:PST family polysaccharide transporter
MSIATKAVTGAAWNLVAGVGSRIVALVGTLVLTRFIAPGEYGEIAVANISVVTAMTVTDVMVGQSIVARRVGPGVCFHAFVLHMATGLVGLLPVVLLAPHIGAAFDAPTMARYVPGFALAALLERLAHVPGRVLVRDMRFRTVAVTRGTAELAFTGVALALAPFIQGNAIVAGNLVRWALVCAVYLRRVDLREWWVPQAVRWTVFRDLLAYGLPLSAATLAEFASSNWDSLLVARFFGTSTAGTYRLSRNLADTPMTNVAEHIGDVLLPSFALMDPGRRNDALVRASSIISLVVVPLCIGLGAVAPTLVHTLFDRRWGEMAPMLMVLSSLAIVRPVTWPLSSFLQAQQRPRTLMLLSFLKVGAMVLLVVTFGRMGPLWTCLAVGLASGLNGMAALLTVQKADGVSAGDFLRGVLRPVLAAIPMFAAVTALRLSLRGLGIDRAWMSLILEVALGGAVYVAAAWVVARPTVDDSLHLVRNAMRRRNA